jgi:acyl-CoA synthetase (AMP-forming)/AMP-acid ligase II
MLTSYRSREIGFVLHQTRARVLVVPQALRGHDTASMARACAAEAGEPQVIVVPAGGDLPEGDARMLAPLRDAGAGAPPRWLYYTSGTTGDPKGVQHEDATLHAAATGLVAAFELAPDDRAALVFPFTHVGGCLWFMASLLSGAGAIVVDTWGPGAIDALARHGVTQAGAGTVFHQAYLAAQRAQPDKRLFSRVRAFPGGGAPKPPGLHHDIKRELGGSGIVSGYGLTECPAITMNRVGDPDDKLADTEGRPTGTVRIVRPDGSAARSGEEGEICVSGAQLFRGYVSGERALDASGLFRTGDLGVLDSGGYLRVTGRLKDIIIRKGENISAKEVEDRLYAHPGVADVAVVGVPDADVGERCCAVVVPRRASDPPTLSSIAAFLDAGGLMRQKIPERLELVREIPRNAAGKVDKRSLRERLI